MYLRYLILVVQLLFPGISSSCNPPELYSTGFNTNTDIFLSRYVNNKDTGLINPETVIQVGAFRLEPNALALKSKLLALTSKIVNIVRKDGYHKVQIKGFERVEEIEALLPALGLLGIKNIWIVPMRKQKESNNQVVTKTDSSFKMIMIKLADPVDGELRPFISRPVFNLQIGVFHDKSKALRAYKKITTRLGLPVKIVQEWEYHKVIVTGFLSIEETFSYYPRLADMGYPNIILLETRK